MNKILFTLLKACMFVLALLVLPFAALLAVPAPTAAPNRQARRAATARRRGAEGRVALDKRRAWYASPMTELQMSRLTALGPILRAVFFDQLQAVAGDSVINQIFNVQTSDRAIERNLGVGGFGNFNKYTGNIEYDSFEQLYTATYTPDEYARGFGIERKLIDDDMYGVIVQRARLLGLAADRTVETSAASLFANAFSASFLGPDGVALCSASHPLSPTDSRTQSNIGTSALTHDSLVSARQAMLRFKDSQNQPMPVNPDTILVPIELEQQARAIVESVNRAGTANNDVNVNRAYGYQIIVSRYLTDTNDWFLIDSRLSKMWCNWYWRVRPEFAVSPMSEYELIARGRAYMRYAFGWDTWQWIYGNQVP